MMPFELESSATIPWPEPWLANAVEAILSLPGDFERRFVVV